MESILGLAWLVLYFAVPVNAVDCFVAARRQRAERAVHASLLCLGVWVGLTLFTVGYVSSGAWYGEYTSLASNIIGSVVVGLLYLVLPIALLVYLRTLRRKLPHSQPERPPSRLQ